jgi:hypothetical protein
MSEDFEPCSEEARALGCTCTMRHDHYDQPPVINRNCPLHGIDPDQAYEDWRDRQNEPDYPDEPFKDEDR